MNYYKKDYYKIKLDKINNVYTYSLSSPRGRILDINGNVLVDNEKKRVIVYQKNKNISKEKELLIASKLSKYLDNNFNITEDEIIAYIFARENIKSFLTDDEYEKLKKSIITYNDAKELSYKYIKKNFLKDFKEEDKKKAKIYSLMNHSYSYDKKIVFQNISDEKYFEILNENLPGITGEYIYTRKYIYGDLLKGIYGSIGKIEKENKDYYLKKRYMLSDLVGTSYLEKEYEDLLKGTKGVYKVKKDGSLELIKKEKKGKDLVLNIDINIELKLSEILKKYILETKGKVNTEYYEGTYVLVGKPTGEVVAALGYKLDDKNNLYETTTDIVNKSFVLGSVVKAASNTVGYHENVIVPGKKMQDSCVKLYMNTEKCSYKRLGYVDDITALEKSSNYYQFINALKVMGYEYKYNMKVNIDKTSFDKYRNIFKEYGLGSKTNIDIPGEVTGQEGKITAADLLLNLSIGQYDAYTPVELLSYINTIATGGKRHNLSFKNTENKIIDEVEITEENMNRIKMGLNNVVKYGTGRGYVTKVDAAGKTGTSETLYDADKDGKYETKTISTSFIGYAPFDKPMYTFALISPNISSNINKSNYKVPINRYILHDLTEFLFEN